MGLILYRLVDKVPIVDRYDVYIFDMDGVIWRGRKIIKNSIATIRLLIKRGFKTIFLTNNSTRSREMYWRKLRRIGIGVPIENIFTSSYCTGKYIYERFGGGSAYVIGEIGLKKELENFNVKIVEDDDVDFVIIGMDRRFNYRKLMMGMRRILSGALFIATNMDKTFPTESGLIPGAGSIVAAMEACVGKEPDIIIGKPGKIMFELILKDLDRDRVLVIGDRLDTDILGANNVGLDSALVLTGISKREDVDKFNIKPQYILKKLSEILK